MAAVLIHTCSRASTFRSRLSGVFLLFDGSCATSGSDAPSAYEFLRIPPGWVNLPEHFWRGTALSSCARLGMVYFMFRRSPQAGLAHSVGCTWTRRGKVSSLTSWHLCRRRRQFPTSGEEPLDMGHPRKEANRGESEKIPGSFVSAFLRMTSCALWPLKDRDRNRKKTADPVGCAQGQLSTALGMTIWEDDVASWCAVASLSRGAGRNAG